MIAWWFYLERESLMQIKITFPSGFDVDGVVLSDTGSKMRVAMRDWDDVAEYECREGQWYSENGDPVGVTGHKPSECFSTTTLRSAPKQLSPPSAWVN
jgi:hypothetical protein